MPLTTVRAKAAVPIAGETLLRRIIRHLVSHSVTDIVVNLHHLPQTIASTVGDGGDLGARVRYSWEQPEILGSAGGVRQALSLLGVETFLVVNGDTLTDVDIGALEGAHRTSGGLVTMALVEGLPKYGGVQVDREGRVAGFTRRGAAADAYHFIGTQIVESDVFAGLPPGQSASTVGGVYDALIAQRPGSVRGFVCSASFWDLGNVSDYWSTTWAFAAREHQVDNVIGRRVDVAETARLSRSLVWDDVIVSDRAVIDGCVITDGVRVPAGAIYRDAILMRKSDGMLQTFPRMTS
jgi:NDP-sugar pyrophosphorylase family protein